MLRIFYVFFISCLLPSCLDPSDDLIKLDLPLCTSSEVRENYLRGDTLTQLKEFKGAWSLQIFRCLFRDDQVKETAEEWRSMNSKPFLADFDTKGNLFILPTIATEGTPTIEPISVQGGIARAQNSIRRFVINLGDLKTSEGIEPLTFELRFEGGRELVVSSNERSQYQSDFEALTGTVYQINQGQVGVFILSQHPIKTP